MARRPGARELIGMRDRRTPNEEAREKRKDRRILREEKMKNDLEERKSRVLLK